jgi:hypothetical protein
MGPAQIFPFDHSAAVTPSDSTNNLYGALYIQNTGTAGAVPIRQNGGYANTTHWLNQGQIMNCGVKWAGVMSTGLGAGVTIVALY